MLPRLPLKLKLPGRVLTRPLPTRLLLARLLLTRLLLTRLLTRLLPTRLLLTFGRVEVCTAQSLLMKHC